MEKCLKEFDAYTAGFWDGDGCFRVYTEKKNGHNIRYKAGCIATNVNREVLDLMQERYDGYIWKRCRCGRKDSYRLQIRGRFLVLSFLERVLPYLTIKKQIAQLLYDLCLNHCYMKNKSEQFKSKELKRRQRIYEKVKAINSIGAEMLVEEKDIEGLEDSLIYPYLAGLVDSEGHLGIYSSKDGYFPVCALQITCEKIPYLFKKYFEGGVYKGTSYEKRAAYMWRINNPDIILSFLEKVKSYLIVKKEQAEILWDFCIDYVDLRNQPDDVKVKEKQRRKELYEKMKKLNERGK